jgi:hypothetical protein
MAGDANYDSLRERLANLTKKTDTSYKQLIKAKRNKGFLTSDERESIQKVSENGYKHPDLDKAENRRNYNYLGGEKLREFNLCLSKGNFGDAKWSLAELKGYTNDPAFMRNYSKEEKEKLIEGINRRIERGMKYLEKNPSDKNINYMKDILNQSKAIENKLLKEESSSGLEKSLAVVSLGSILAGIFLLTPNLTGNVVGNLTRNSTNIFGGLLFILGLVGTFLIIKR